MERPFFHRFGSFLWGGIVILLGTLAVYVSVGRLLVTNVSAWHEEILLALNSRGPFVVEAERIRGEWRSFSPVLVLSGLRLGIADSGEPPLALSRGRANIDVLDSLRTGTLQLSRVVLEDLSLYGEVTSSGTLRLQGLGASDGEDNGEIREFLLNVEAITLRNNRLVLTLPDGEERSMDLDLTLSRDRSYRRLDATLTSTRGAEINVLAEGIGDPFNPDLFSGQVYADIRSPDMGAVKDLFAGPPPPLWAEGVVDLEVWFDWQHGASSMQARLGAEDILVAPQDDAWQVPLDSLSFQAGLQRNEGRWQLFVDGLQAARDGAVLRLPRLQLQGEENLLRARTGDVALEALAEFGGKLDVIPAKLRTVLAELNPRGELTALELQVDDLEERAVAWEVSATFKQLEVEPVKGAPGVSGVAGFTQLGPGGGHVLFDSREITLDFPLVYEEPLNFDDLFGTLNLRWDADAVRLDSGLLTTRGEEGTARVLFALDIPLQQSDRGIEMGLLVGLQNAHPTHRAKYIPYVLNPTLQDWLSESIGEGVIEQGAFLWNGSLKKGAGPLRTVQMAFNVTDTQLTYHPKWPPVLVREGIVLIDDAEVSVWAERAELFQSDVRSLSVETRVNDKKQITLAVHGDVAGPAADGLRVLNESPLSGIVGSAFADWQLDGSLETVLDLQMNLGDTSVAPQVEVATVWQDVDMTIMPGNLLVQGIEGEFDYSTSAGFSSRSLAGELWGRAVSAELSQHNPSGERGYDPATSVVEVALATEVDMRDLVDWLQLDLLGFATGRAAADVQLSIAPGAPPLLAIESDLRGVSLDLPQPWSKQAGEERPVSLDLPLGKGAMPLTMALGEELLFRFDLAEGRLSRGALGINAQPPAAQAGELRVAGHASVVPVDEWLDFVETYITGSAESPDPAQPQAPAAQDQVPADAGAQRADLVVTIDKVLADRLLFRGQDIDSVSLGLAVNTDLVRLSLDTDWLGAGLILPREAGPAQLDVEYLDLDRLPAFSADARHAEVELEEEDAHAGETGSGQPALDLPLLNITLANIFQSEQRLGDLAFALQSRDGVMNATGITGEVASLRLSPERPARLTWHLGNRELTEIRASFGFENLGDTLEDLGYERIVETERGSINIDLHWPAAPNGFSLLLAQGAVDLAFESGNFLEAPSGAEGALRVVSILNLADIVRRLSLSQMFESGIPFDSVRGEIYLHAGTVEVAYLDVKGGSSFYFSGVSDVASQGLGGELVATLPVANNLPWIAALAASLPVAAGVFVVSQVFNKQVNRLSSAVYTIGGTWDEPEVEFDRIFDNTKKSSGGAGAAGGLSFETREAQRLPPVNVKPDAAAQPVSP